MLYINFARPLCMHSCLSIIVPMKEQLHELLYIYRAYIACIYSMYIQQRCYMRHMVLTGSVGPVQSTWAYASRWEDPDSAHNQHSVLTSCSSQLGLSESYGVRLRLKYRPLGWLTLLLSLRIPLLVVFYIHSEIVQCLSESPAFYL